MLLTAGRVSLTLHCPGAQISSGSLECISLSEMLTLCEMQSCVTVTPQKTAFSVSTKRSVFEGEMCVLTEMATVGRSNIFCIFLGTLKSLGSVIYILKKCIIVLCKNALN